MRWLSVILLVFVSVCTAVAQELTAEELYTAGVEAYWAEQENEALDLFTQTIVKDYARTYYVLGFAYRELGRYNETLDMFVQVEQVDPSWVVGTVQRGVTLANNTGDILGGIAKNSTAPSKLTLPMQRPT